MYCTVEWVVQISVRTVEDIEDDDTTFGSEMCHQVFGENENIFGYMDLRIKLYYTAASLQTYLGIDYSEKVQFLMFSLILLLNINLIRIIDYINR